MPRKGVLRDGIEGAVQSVVGLRQPARRYHPAGRPDGAVHAAQPRHPDRFFWVNFAITVVATLYFGWHYVADDIAGVVDRPRLRSGVGGLASGQKFDRGGLASHPTSTTSKVPVDAD